VGRWRHIAQPQPDGTDTAIVLASARRYGWVRPRQDGAPAILNRRVAVRPLPAGKHAPNGWRPGDASHEHFREAGTYLRLLWPEVASQFCELVSTVYAVELETSPRLGYSSDHWITGPFTIALTCFDPFGTTEGMVHELAHLKFIYLGVPREGKSVFLRNLPSELYPSPVRGCKRPMTAVLHAFYSWVHMLDLDLRIAPVNRDWALRRLPRNLEWVSEMRTTLDRHARWTREGEAWYEGAREWTDLLLRRV
jgi:HEXXH motif-containing protein